MAFHKAERRQVRLKLGISGASGSGKTYSALLMAYGLCGDWGKIAVIDTENGSAELYSHLGGYSVETISAPFEPQKYIDAINEAEKAGFEVLIIDSLSHAWSGEGGLLDIQNAIAKASRSGNSYTAWRDVSPLHAKLVDAFLQCNMDVIVTTRAKTAYEMVDVNGKKTPQKVGLEPVFRDGLEFEVTTFFSISQDHIAQATKDRTSLFDGKYFTPSEETGKTFAEWRNSGTECKCSVCGKPISYKIYTQSMKKYGQAYCSAACVNNANKGNE